MMMAMIALLVAFELILVFSETKKVKNRPRQFADMLEDSSIELKSKREIEEKLAEMNKEKLKGVHTEHELTPIELEKINIEELSIRKKIEMLPISKKDISLDRANLLHKLGGILYKKKDYQAALLISQEILLVHEKLDGVNHINTAKALTNVGSVAHRLKKLEYCELVERRALNIFIKHYGSEAKEVLLQKGRMLSFGIPETRTSKGLSYEEFVDELEYLELNEL